MSRTAVTPRGMDTLLCPLDALHDARVDVRMLPRLTPLRDLWSTTLHVSGIRLRNALGW